MGAQTPPMLMDLMGIAFWGDLGPLTMYKSHWDRMVWFSKTWPKKPATDKQLEQRQKFRDAADAWNALSPAVRDSWHRATCAASLPMTGYSLWVYYQLTNDELAIRTIERQTGRILLPP